MFSCMAIIVDKLIFVIIFRNNIVDILVPDRTIRFFGSNLQAVFVVLSLRFVIGEKVRLVTFENNVVDAQVFTFVDRISKEANIVIFTHSKVVIIEVMMRPVKGKRIASNTVLSCIS